ncbi:Serine carboxypeptidase [Ceratobasidium sp. AG-Ba]|nr:Serine carboxypeptidase [Ceratobasidium sp. AG-Ba]
MKLLSFTGFTLATLAAVGVARGIPPLDNGLDQFAMGARVEHTYEHFSHASFPSHQLRLRSPKLCDPTVIQHSGYLDVSDERHIFFWFFEARNNPSTAPVVIWLNGGPGCSSTTGLFFALGPCSIQDRGNSTTWNEWSWNNNANMLFIDQPAGVGYSYNSGPAIDNSFMAADDMWAFLQLFYKRFPRYNGELHVAGESYAGTYIPHIASAIHKHNQVLANENYQHINLSTIIMGNGLTDPYSHFPTLYEWYCHGKWNILDGNGPQCQRLKKAVGICQRMIKICEDFDTSFTCGPAGAFCFEEIFQSTVLAHINPYDARMKCDNQDQSDECYHEIPWISTYLNTPRIKAELGIASENNFTACNTEIHQKFVTNGDAARSSAILLPELIEAGLRVLVYAGDADTLCPGMSQTPWMENLNTTFQKHFINAPILPFQTHNRTAGLVRTTGSETEAGQIALVEIYDAGHMAPHDQPDASLDMFNRWIGNKPLRG